VTGVQTCALPISPITVTLSSATSALATSHHFEATMSLSGPPPRSLLSSRIQDLPYPVDPRTLGTKTAMPLERKYCRYAEKARSDCEVGPPCTSMMAGNGAVPLGR